MANQKTGTSVNGIHGRDNFLLNIISIVAGGLQCERNRGSQSTLSKLRLDGFLFQAQGTPPIVIFEERSSSLYLAEAENDITTKFRFLPHYEVPWIVALAIAGDTVTFHAFGPGGFLPTPEPKTFQLSNVWGRAGSVNLALPHAHLLLTSFFPLVPLGVYSESQARPSYPSANERREQRRD